MNFRKDAIQHAKFRTQKSQQVSGAHSPGPAGAKQPREAFAGQNQEKVIGKAGQSVRYLTQERTKTRGTG